MSQRRKINSIEQIAITLTSAIFIWKGILLYIFINKNKHRTKISTKIVMVTEFKRRSILTEGVLLKVNHAFVHAGPVYPSRKVIGLLLCPVGSYDFCPHSSVINSSNSNPMCN